MVASPPTPAPPLASRNIAASLARAGRRLALAATDAVVRLLLVEAFGDAFLFLGLASGWLLAAGIAALDLDIDRVFCGEDCAVVLAAARVSALFSFSFAILSAPAVLVFVIRAAIADSGTDEAEDPDFEVDQEPGSRSLAAAMEEVLCYPVMLGVLATVPFLLLVLSVGLMGNSPVMESALGATGALCIDVLYCFVIIPTVVLKVWKVTRPGWRCRSDVEKNP